MTSSSIEFRCSWCWAAICLARALWRYLPIAVSSRAEATANSTARRVANEVRRGPFLVADFHGIAAAPDRVDQLSFERVVNLASQAADCDFDDVGVAVEIHIPDLLGDQRARQNLAGSSE